MHLHQFVPVGEHLYGTLILIDDDWNTRWEGWACWRSPDEIEVNIADLAWTLNTIHGYESKTALTLAEQMIGQAIERAPKCRYVPDFCPWWFPRISTNWEVRF